MEPIENGQRHADIGDDDPRPQSVELQLDGIDFRPALLQSGHGPHGEVGHQQEGDDLAARFAPLLLRRTGAASGRVQNEQRLTHRLHHQIIRILSRFLNNMQQ